MEFEDRLTRTLERVREAETRRGPGPSVRLVGVSKRHPSAAIAGAYRAGLRDLGENYAQELAKKRAELDLPELRWHFIGSLQRNKVKLVLGSHLIHTLDRGPLLHAIERRAAAADLVQDVLVEINAGESQKGGVTPELAGQLIGEAQTCAHVRVRGLMVMPPFGDLPGACRVFERTRALRDELAAEFPDTDLTELSMGMSADFEEAIAAGATIVRVGTALFGPRPT